MNINSDESLYPRTLTAYIRLPMPPRFWLVLASAADSLALPGQIIQQPVVVKDFLVAKLAGIEQ